MGKDDGGGTHSVVHEMYATTGEVSPYEWRFKGTPASVGSGPVAFDMKRNPSILAGAVVADGG